MSSFYIDEVGLLRMKMPKTPPVWNLTPETEFVKCTFGKPEVYLSASALKPYTKPKEEFMLFGISLERVKKAVREVFAEILRIDAEDKTQIIKLNERITTLQAEKIKLDDNLAQRVRIAEDSRADIVRRAEDKAADLVRKAEDRAAAEVRVKQTEIDTIKARSERDQSELEFLAKQNEERLTIESDKREIALQKRFQKEKMELQEKFYQDTIKILDGSKGDLQKVYTEIMTRLPKVEAFVESTNRQPSQSKS